MTAAERTVGGAIRAALLTADPAPPRSWPRARWRATGGSGAWSSRSTQPMPDRPARPDAPELLPPNRMPKRNKGGSERESDRACGMRWRISSSSRSTSRSIWRGGSAPRWAADSCPISWRSPPTRQCTSRCSTGTWRRSGSGYGALPAHDGLWQAAEPTRARRRRAAGGGADGARGARSRRDARR